MAKVYCPFCRSPRPMIKAGWSLRPAGRPPKQKYQCRNRGCFRVSSKPLKSRPRQKKEKS